MSLGVILLLYSLSGTIVFGFPLGAQPIQPRVLGHPCSVLEAPLKLFTRLA